MSNGIAGGDMAGTRGSDNVSIPRFILEDSPKLARKIQDFEDLERRAAEATATIGDVGEIASIRGQAKQARDDADAELAKQKELTEHSRVECERLISEATESASRKIAEAESTVQARVAVADGKLSVANQEASAIAEGKRSNEVRAGALDNQEASLQQKADDLASREQELTETKERFAKLRELIQQNIP
jgi:hypothetical protein